MATRVGKSGFWISIEMPASKRDVRRDCKSTISVGNLSEVIIICLPVLVSTLKVLKNSSCTFSLPDQN
ncbi:MAG: hypothetical protein Q611_LSC00314G0002 [Leuconostoc sp. DORA_2]|nr:MAG: hypothetical protein Q611_LSC00314G0002 [Leuconostoc sp. DORA_2]